MMYRSAVVLSMLGLATCAHQEAVVEPAADVAPVAPEQVRVAETQLQQLVAPIALYPDALVGQILAASTYPTEIQEAETWMQQHSNLKGEDLAKEVDKQSWDPSVKALTEFPSVLANMQKNLSWTSALGDAYTNQQQDVLNAVQVMRQRAQQAGNLKSTPQQTVATQGQTIVIQPTDPQVVYVPAYDPWVVYGPPLAVYPGWDPYGGLYAVGPGISFGLGFGIGFFGGFGWGFHHWDTDFHHHHVDFDHHRFISHGRDFDHRGFHGGEHRGFHGGEFHGGTRSGAFSGFNHGGMARGFSGRGESSVGGRGVGGGGFQGGGVSHGGGGFHGGGGGGFHGGGGGGGHGGGGGGHR
jgi:uncharacterized membrane protein YgcG